MWSRHHLLWGLAGAVAAAALAITLLWLLLVAIERTHAAEPLQIHALAIFALPGLIVYPACWYALIFRRRRYDARDTCKLLAVSYAACCFFDFAIIGTWHLWQGAVMAVQMLAKSPSPWAFVFLLAPVGLAIFTLIAAVGLAIPYTVTAAPVAFVHRAVWLACATRRETA